MDESPLHIRNVLEPVGPSEPPVSVAVRRFLISQGVREHNHASELARILKVDRSQSYRRLKGDVAWSATDLRAVAMRYGAPDDQFQLPDEPRPSPALGIPSEAVPATIRIAALPPQGLLLVGPELGADETSDLVAVQSPGGWEVYVNGDEPIGALRHAIEALTVRSLAHLRIALLEDDARTAESLVEAFRPLGIVATSFADGTALLGAITHRRFDAFVLDWLLSDGNAARVVESIRSHRPHVPVIVVTGALAAVEMEKTLLDLSAQWNFSTLDKPVRPMNLANALKQMVAVARD
jgi:CheY-like chemotaxis protein